MTLFPRLAGLSFPPLLERSGSGSSASDECAGGSRDGNKREGGIQSGIGSGSGSGASFTDGIGCVDDDARDYGVVIKANEGLCHHPHLSHTHCLSTISIRGGSDTTSSFQPVSEPLSNPVSSSQHMSSSQSSNQSLSFSEPLSLTLFEEIYELVLGALISIIDDLAARAADKGQALALSAVLDPGMEQNSHPHIPPLHLTSLPHYTTL